jgi:hypothetical protein
MASFQIPGAGYYQDAGSGDGVQVAGRGYLQESSSGGGGGGAPGGGGLGGSTDWQSKKKPGTAYVGYSGVGTSGIGSGKIDGFTWA